MTAPGDADVTIDTTLDDPIRTYRFMLADGRTVDFHTYRRDSSDVRGELLAHPAVGKGATIVGSTELGLPEPTTPKKGTK